MNLYIFTLNISYGIEEAFQEATMASSLDEALITLTGKINRKLEADDEYTVDDVKEQIDLITIVGHSLPAGQPNGPGTYITYLIDPFAKQEPDRITHIEHFTDQIQEP